MDLKLTYQPTPGYLDLVSPATHPIQELHFGMLWLPPGERYTAESGAEEIGMVILTGTCAITIGDDQFRDLGGRTSVFDDRATGIYVPMDSSFTVEAGQQGVEIACCRCEGQPGLPAQVVRPEEVLVRDVGGEGFRRYVHDVLGPQVQASRLIIGETFTIAGNWSSYPPHKHDTEALPQEVRQEELYLYKVRPAEGFGLQLFYTRPDSTYPPLDLAIPVRENDITLMPYGYHPVAAPPGYDVYYLWFLSGPIRQLIPNDDPTHSWVKTDQSPPREYPH